ncbi:MAG: type II secretion system protein GspM [Haliea sp.]|uniref:type II secretion system protein GspM n=1 Tax=Haliea sp. TaxID=1932666 RepID=UPI0032EF0D27
MNSILRTVTAMPAHARVVAAVLVAALFVLLLLVAGTMVSWYAEGSQRLQHAEPRIARLLGFADSVEALRASSEQIGQRLEALAYPATADLASTGANAQQQVRRLAEAAGLGVTGSQVLGPTGHDGFQEIRIDVTASGTMDGVEQVLLGLREARPLILVRSIEVTPVLNRRQQTVQNVALSLRVSVLKLQ